MTERRPAFHRWARLSLLVAALLYFAGAAAGPWAHAHATVWSPGPAIGQTDADPPGPAPHNELACFVCQALGSIVVPSAGASLPPASASKADPLPEPLAGIPSLRFADSRARAPPTV